MRVYAKIFRGSDVPVSSPSLLVFYGIHLLMAMSQVEGFFAVRRLQVLGVGKRVPKQVAHGCQRNAVLVVVDIGLHASDVNRCGKTTIANGERSQWVGLGNKGIVAKKNSLAIYRGCYVFCGVS